MGLQHQLLIQSKLETLLGTRNVYFQPPENLQMKYPCIVYTLDYERTLKANNEKYQRNRRYQVTCIDRDPNSVIPDKLFKLPHSAFARAYTADNLHHTVYDIYF